MKSTTFKIFAIVLTFFALSVNIMAQEPNGTLPPNPSEDWWTATQDNLRQAEYQVTWQAETLLPDVDSAFQAPNRAQNMRLYFTPDKVRVIDRTTTHPEWELSVGLTNFGGETQLQPLRAATLSTQDNRIEYQRATVNEWFINAETGLEHGFTLSTPPDNSGSLVFQLEFQGDLEIYPLDNNQALKLSLNNADKTFEYGDLHVFDATGKALAAEFAIIPPTDKNHHPVQLIVDTTDALYPITVDPTLTALSTTYDWMVDKTGNFGSSVSAAGDVNGDGYTDVIVAAPTYNTGSGIGRVYGFYGSATGLSTEADWIVDYLGNSVSLAGDVNGDGYADVILGGSGHAYVFYGSAIGLSWTPDWSATGGGYFGNSVDMAGDVNGDGYSDVIVGSYNYDDAAYVYYGSATGLSTAYDWMATGGNYFGYSVSTAGDVNGDGYSDVIVGSYVDNVTYVYYGSVGGLSTTYDWMETEGRYSVSTAGDVNGDGYSDVIVGRSNRAYVYLGSTIGLSTTYDWMATVARYSVSTAGDVNGDGYSDVIIGDYNSRRAYVYLGSVNGLSTTYDWMATGGDYFGYSVSTAGDVNGDGYSDVIVGEIYYDRAYVYYGSAVGLHASAEWQDESTQATAQLGYSVASAGDVNGDGYADILASAPFYDTGFANAGRVQGYLGSPGGPGLSPDWTLDGTQADGFFGQSANRAGDVNGDGYGDVVVGAPGENRAYLYQGNLTGLNTSPAATLVETQTGADFGNAVSSAGDVNGDGFGDVVVGAPHFDGAETDSGKISIFHGAADGLSTLPATEAIGTQANAQLGYSVASAGDVNGDGYGDVIAGAPLFDGILADEGSVLIYQGGLNGIGSVSAQIFGGQAGAQLGYSVSGAGDVNGDGYADLIAGAPFFDNGQLDEGRAMAYAGSALGVLTDTVAWAVEVNQADAQFGFSVASAGDVDGNGYSDVIVGTPYFDEYDIADRGVAMVYQGFAGGLSTAYEWKVTGNQIGEKLGYAVSGAGDANGDGYGDVLVGAPGYDNQDYDRGRFALYFGNDGLDNLPAATRQMRVSEAVPVAPWGVSDKYTDIRITRLVTPPLGQQDVKLQWEIAPSGVPFTATSQISSGQSATWQRVITPNTILSATISGLEPGAVYHWRTRVLYRPGNALGQVAGPWRQSEGQSWTDTDFRTGTDYAAITNLQISHDAPTELGSMTSFTATYSITDAAQRIYTQYTWDFGDGTAPINTADDLISHTYTATGTYTAVLTAENRVSVVTQTTTVSIVDEPVSGLHVNCDSPTAWTQATVCQATLDSGTNVRYIWDMGDAMPENGASIEHTYVDIGVYTVTVIATNSVNTAFVTTTVQVEDPIVGLVADSNSPTELGVDTQFSATVGGGSNVQYTWDFGDGTLGYQPAMSHTYAAVGVYTAIITAENAINTATASTAVIVDEAISGLSAIASSPTELGQATSLSAAIQHGSNATYLWQFGDGTSGSGATQQHTYPTLGIFTATVTVNNSVSLVSDTVRIEVVVPSNLSVSAGNNSPTTLGYSTAFNASSLGIDYPTYFWTFGDGFTAYGSAVSHAYAQPGYYTATVVASGGVLTASTTTDVQIVDVAISSLSASSNSPTNLGNATQFSASVWQGTNVNYLWNFGDGITATGASVGHVYNATGNYTAVVTASNTANSSSKTVAVSIQDVPIFGLTMEVAKEANSRTVNFTAHTVNGSNVIYDWYFGDGLIDTGKTVTYTYAANGTYIAQVIAHNSVNSQNTSQSVTVTGETHNIYLPLIIR